MFGSFFRKAAPAASSQTPTRQTSIPFTTFDGWLKYMRPAEFDPLQTIAMKASFARFYSEAETNTAATAATDRALGFSLPVGTETAFRFRRFAGGRDLPPGRYYAVAQNEFGWDGGSLVAELSSYIDPAKSGPVHVVDVADPMHIGTTWRFRAENPGFPEHAVAVTFLRRDGWASPYFEALKSAKGLRFGPFVAYLGNQNDIATIYFRTHVERARIDKVIDLRRPDVRAWMTRELFGGIPTIRYLYGETYDIKDKDDWLHQLAAYATPALYLDAGAEDAAAAAERADATALTAPQMLFYSAAATKAELSLQRPVATQRYQETLMLRLLTFSAEGGSPITEAIGTWLRTLGADAFIYPSARMNGRVLVENGTVTEFSGFNLVDYRNAPPPPHTLRIVQRPVTFLDFNHLRFPVTGPPPTEPQFAGSFTILGLAEHQQDVRTYLEEAAQIESTKQAAPPTPSFPESTFRRVFRLPNGEMSSIPEMRVHAAAGTVTLLDPVVSTQTGQTGEVGGWLLGFLRDRVGDGYTQTINWGGEWFCFVCDTDAVDPRTFDLICPVCEADTRWSPEVSPPPASCAACGFTQSPISTDDDARARFRRIHEREAGW